MVPTHPNHTSTDPLIEVRVCDWHLRRIFWDERLWERYYTYELDILWGPLRERKNPTSTAPSKYNQEIIFIDPHTGRQVARCHTFIEADGVTLGGKGLPDPKHITWKGFDYHLTEKGGSGCEHCASRISTWPTGNPLVNGVPTDAPETE
jgi:hypothetical protein